MEQLYALIREKAKEKLEGSHRMAAEIVAGMIRGSKHWTLEMVSQTHLHSFVDLDSISTFVNISCLDEQTLGKTHTVSYRSLHQY